MFEIVETVVEKETPEIKKFTHEDYEEARKALLRLRDRAESMPAVDAVVLIREIRDSGERSDFE